MTVVVTSLEAIRDKIRERFVWIWHTVAKRVTMMCFKWIDNNSVIYGHLCCSHTIVNVDVADNKYFFMYVCVAITASTSLVL